MEYKKEMVLVSVLMTAFNREKYLVEAIESVLSSTYSNFELIICDDASTDGTIDIAKKYALKDKRIHVYINEKNIGDYANRNRVASYAKGKYLKYVDSDDKIYSWGLEYCVQMMERFEDAAMGIYYIKEKVKEEYLQPADAIQRNFFESSILNIGPSGTILNRLCFEKEGRFDAIYGPASDLFFNLKMASRYPIVLLKREFFFYRVHEGQELNNKYSYLCYNYKYFSDALNFPGFPLNEKQKKFLLQKAEFYYVKDLLVYLESSKNVKKTLGAFSISGMRGFKVVRGFINLVLMKCGLQKFRPVDK